MYDVEFTASFKNIDEENSGHAAFDLDGVSILIFLIQSFSSVVYDKKLFTLHRSFTSYMRGISIFSG